MLAPRVLAVTAWVASLQQVKAFSMDGSRLLVERIDPIVSVGKPSFHAHNFVGANGIAMDSTYESLQESTCTTLPVQKDHSVYWQPQLYHYDPADQTYEAVPSYSAIYYLRRPDGDELQPFPKGLKIVAGDSTRSTNDPSNTAHQAVKYVCEGSGLDDRPDFKFGATCVWLRAQVVFPACWDGKNLDNSKGPHMSYPVGPHADNGRCPPEFPVHLITLFYEFKYDTKNFKYNENGPTWVLSNGDATGLSLHADFQNGWEEGLLDKVIKDCDGPLDSTDKCPHLQESFDHDAAYNCQMKRQILDEDYGLTKGIKKLPGCNTMYTSGPRPECNTPVPEPGLTAAPARTNRKRRSALR